MTRSTSGYFRRMATANFRRAMAEIAEVRAVRERPDLFLVASIPNHESNEATELMHLHYAEGYRDSARSYRRMAREEDAYQARQAARAIENAKLDAEMAEMRARWAATDSRATDDGPAVEVAS